MEENRLETVSKELKALLAKYNIQRDKTILSRV